MQGTLQNVFPVLRQGILAPLHDLLLRVLSVRVRQRKICQELIIVLVVAAILIVRKLCKFWNNAISLAGFQIIEGRLRGVLRFNKIVIKIKFIRLVFRCVQAAISIVKPCIIIGKRFAGVLLYICVRIVLRVGVVRKCTDTIKLRNIRVNSAFMIGNDHLDVGVVHHLTDVIIRHTDCAGAAVFRISFIALNLNSGIKVKAFISPRILVKTIVALDGVAVLIAQKAGPSLCFASNYGLAIQRNRWHKAHVQLCAGKAKQANEALHLGISVHGKFFCAHVCHQLAVVEEHFRHKVAEALNANTAHRKSSVGVPRIGRDSPSVLITGSLQQFTLILRFAQKRLGRAGPIMGNDGAVQCRIRLFDFLKPAAGKQLPGRKMFCDTGIIQDGFHKASRAFSLVVCFFRNGSNNLLHRRLVCNFAVHDFGCIKNPVIFVCDF